MTPTLLEAAREHVAWLRRKWKEQDVEFIQKCEEIQADRLEAAILAEESKPKVERRTIFDGPFGWSIEGLSTADGWTFYAERPVPAAPKEPSIEERLDSAMTPLGGGPLDSLLREAAAEIRRLKEGRG